MIESLPQVILPRAFVVKATPGQKVYTIYNNVPREAIVVAIAPVFGLNAKSKEMEVVIVSYRLKFSGTGTEHSITCTGDEVFLTFDELLKHFKKSLIKL